MTLQYAGNVLVYGPASPCDGDWYGGVTVDSAGAFLDALIGADVAGHGGVSEPALRPLWRGRMGLTKEEQLQVRPVVTLHDAGASCMQLCCTSKAILAGMLHPPAHSAACAALSSDLGLQSMAFRLYCTAVSPSMDA